MIRPAILLALATAATLAACGKDSNEVPNPVSVSTLKDIVNADNIEARTSQIVTEWVLPLTTTRSTSRSR